MPLYDVTISHTSYDIEAVDAEDAMTQAIANIDEHDCEIEVCDGQDEKRKRKRKRTKMPKNILSKSDITANVQWVALANVDQASRDLAGELVKDAREALKVYEAVDGWRNP